MPATMEAPPTPTPSLASTASQASLTPARLTSTPSRKHLRSSPSNPYSSAYGSPRPVVPTSSMNNGSINVTSTAPSASTSTRVADSSPAPPPPLSLRPNTFGRRGGKNGSGSHVGQAGTALAAGNGHSRPIGKLASPSKPSNAVTPTHVTTHVITQSVTHPYSPYASASTSTSTSTTTSASAPLPATAKTSNAASSSVSGIPTPSVRQRVDALTRANDGSASTSTASISAAGAMANSSGLAARGNAPSLRGVSSVPNINTSKSNMNTTITTITSPMTTMQAPANKNTTRETLAAPTLPSLRGVSSVPNINQSKATLNPTTTIQQLNTNETATKEALTTQPNNIPAPTLMAPPPPARAPSPVPAPARTPARPPTKDIQHRVSRSVGCLPVPSSPRASPFGSGQTLESPKLLDEPLLLPDPNLWSTSELAQHLAWALRTGGSDGIGPTLPAVVVEDVVSWVLRQRVTGRKFLRGVSEISGSRPPPFLPVLAAMSKRLRRQYRDGDTASDISDVTEESESSPDAVSRVKRLAHAFDSISSASEVSGDEDLGLSALRAQVAPETSHGFGRATPKKEARGWRRRDSAASASSIASLASGVSDASIGSSVPRWRQRCLSNASDENLWNAPAPLADSPTAKLSKGKADPDPMASPDAGTAAVMETSPPPPYVPTAPASPMRTGLLFPDPSTPDGSRSSSVTPLHTETRNTPAPELSPVHLMRMGAHRDSGVDPYAVLRHEGRPRRPGMPFHEQNAHDADNDSDSDSDGNRPHWTTTRRVTARPRGFSPSKRDRDGAAIGLAPPERTPGSRHSTPSSRRHARELEALVDRIRELESRLAAVETDKDKERSPSEEAAPPEMTETRVELDSPAKTKLKEEDEEDVVELVSPGVARMSSPKSPVSPLHIVPVYAAEVTQSLDSDSDPTTPTASCPTPSPGSAYRSLSQSVELDLDLENIDEGNDTSSDTNNSKALVPYTGGQRRSWLSLIGLVGPDGSEPRLFEIPAVVFLMGIGVGVGFSAVVIRVLMGKKM